MMTWQNVKQVKMRTYYFGFKQKRGVNGDAAATEEEKKSKNRSKKQKNKIIVKSVLQIEKQN